MFRAISLNFIKRPPYNTTNSIDLVPNPKSSLMDSTSHPLNTSFPILLISIIGIITTAVVLLSYYIFVIKCCLFRFRRISPPHFNLHRPTESRGLHPSAINSIPAVRFTKSTASSFQCAICIAAFEEREVLRLLPNCAHAFHLDCIDTWLQSNANCPLCRAQISGAFGNVVDVDGGAFSIVAPVAREEMSVGRKKKLKMASMDDECVNTVREREERFVVEPIRRSFSMDSSNDPALYLTVQHILRHSDDTRVKRLFSFGRSSRRTSVLPL